MPSEESGDTDLRLSLDVEAPDRADRLLLRALRARAAPGAARSAIKALFRDGRVQVSGHRTSASALLSAGRHALRIIGFDPRELEAPEAAPSTRGAFLPVVYEDSDLLVLDKASGVPSVPHSREETETAVGAALARDPELSGKGQGGLEPGLLHRLDTGTSGLLVFAKSDEEFERLRAAWKSGEVRKTYRALARSEEHAPRPRIPQSIELELGHDAKSPRRMLALAPGRRPSAIRGKPLPTRTRLLRLRDTATPGILDFELEIETGVMHQIRCTLAFLGWPILGDEIYRGASYNRLWLHAWKLSIPLKNQLRLELEAPLPSGWLASG